MREFDEAVAQPTSVRRREQADPGIPGAVLGRGAADGRPDVVGPAGMLRLQRAVGNAGTASMMEEDRSPVHDVISSPGESLDRDVRSDMEGRLGADFSDVRVHRDSAAHESAQSVQAKAYTVGSHVVFQRDAYDPGSDAGKHVLAHELTHVVQQRSGPVDGAEAPGGIRVSDPSDRYELAASESADRAMSAAPPAQAAGVQRQAAEEEEEAAQTYVQRQEEDELQTYVQRQAAEEEEEAAQTYVQRQEEDELQTYVQREAAPEEEEAAQTYVQRQAEPEEEEEAPSAQTYVQRQEELPEEPV